MKSRRMKSNGVAVPGMEALRRQRGDLRTESSHRGRIARYPGAPRSPRPPARIWGPVPRARDGWDYRFRSLQWSIIRPHHSGWGGGLPSRAIIGWSGNASRSGRRPAPGTGGSDETSMTPR